MLGPGAIPIPAPMAMLGAISIIDMPGAMAISVVAALHHGRHM